MLHLSPATGQDSLQVPMELHKTVVPWKPFIKFDSVSVYPQVTVRDRKGHVWDSLSYETDAVKALIFWRDTAAPDTLIITWYRYPPGWYGWQRERKLPGRYVFSQTRRSGKQPQAGAFFDELKVRGIWEQGMEGGNNRQAYPVNKMDLRMSGLLTDRIRVDARIRDDNTPMGYEGITTTFKDLNRIYMKVSAPRWYVSGGDSLWEFRSSLLHFRRDNRGIGAGYDTGRMTTEVAAASVKGRSVRQEFVLKSSEYGPFLLRTRDGQRGIYILHGSDKVYLNGRLLQRGTDKDYTLDYMRARLRLNPGLTINEGDRLTVEFQYAALDFARWSSWVRASLKNEHQSWEIFSYNETDLKTRALIVPLDSSVIDTLSRIPEGDRIWVRTVRPAVYDPAKILYKKVQSGNTEYFVYATDSSETLYEVYFGYAGTGKGDYTVERYLAAGPVYKYVGTGQGDFRVGYPLRPPSAKRFTGLRWHAGDSLWNAGAEAVLMTMNPNRLYRANDNRRKALAWSWQAGYGKPYGRGWYGETGGRILPSYYRSPDPLHSVTALQEWGLSQIPGENSLFATVSAGYGFPKHRMLIRQSWLTGADSIKLGRIMLGYKTDSTLNRLQWEGERVYGKTGRNSRHEYGRLRMAWHHQGKTWQPYSLLRNEKKLRRVSGLPDSTAYNRRQWEGGVKYIRKSWKIHAWIRQNLTDSIRQAHWQPVSDERIAGWQTSYGGKNLQWQAQIRYLNDRYKPQKRRWDFLGSISGSDRRQIHRFTVRAGQISARLIRNEIVFRKVPAGQGQYRWVDYNNDGVAQNDEFEPAYYSDQADYIMVILPSTYTLPSVEQQAMLQWRFHPGRYFRRPPLPARWTIALKAEMHRAALQDAGNRLPVPFSVAQTADDRIHYRQQWHLNNHWYARYSLSLHQAKNLTYNGHTRRFDRRHRWELKWRDSTGYAFVPFFEHIYTSAASEDYPIKNFSILNRTAGADFLLEGKTLGWKTSFRFIRMQSDAGQYLKHWQAKGMLQGRHKNNRWSVSLQYSYCRFDGNPYSPAGYRMLEGLMPGGNLISEWRWRKALRPGMFLQLFYQIRRIPGSPTVQAAHIGLQAVF
ncbi:MAG: hypothetical protein GXO24_02945 [Chlorobi bacterium]|nr:hypothetical protein [Chlorobiota bacterium]